MVEILRGYELRLLRCTLSPAPSDSHPQPPPSDSPAHSLHAHINELLGLIESGNYLQALSSVPAKVFFGELPKVPESPDRVYSDLVERRVEEFIGNGGGEEEKACRVILVFSIAVAAFLCFTQRNITGPVDEFPICPLLLGLWEGGESGVWEDWARRQVMSDSSHLVGKLYNLQYIVFAKMLVMRTKDLLFEGSISSVYGFRSISWWLARILLVEQRILDELSSSLFDLLQVYTGENLRQFGILEQVTSYWGSKLCDGEAIDIVSMAHLEAGMMEHIYGRADSCRKHLELAKAAAELELSVTGVLGYRTLHQIEPKVQRVLVTSRSSETHGGTIPVLNSSQSHDLRVVEDNTYRHMIQNSEFDNILITPKLVENVGENGIRAQSNQDCDNGATPLKAIQQAVILAQCLLINRSSREDELQKWDMAPFIEAIDSQQSSFFVLRYFCDLLRIRWESTRSRTKARALEMMSNLVEGIEKKFPIVRQRIPFCYVAYIPTIPALQKEYGQLLVGCGLIGEALRIFEDLELWDNLIYCYSLLGKNAAAIELIKKRLCEMPNDPSLWCSLGDVTNDDSCYEKALEVSNDKSARAKRSLARSAYNRGDYQKSKTLWESAMAMNSLYADGWFALGAAALKARDVDEALHAFTRAVKLDPDNGEAWNNIACLHMIKKKSKEASISFKEALKFKRDSWQMWENYSHVAMDIGDIRQALEAVQNVLQLTGLKRIDVVLLERVMVEIEGRSPSKLAMDNDQCISSQISVLDSDSVNESEPRVTRSRETEQLLELLGKLLQQIVKNGGGGDIWGLFARWHKLKGDLTMCSEALLKQVRSYQGSDLWKDRDRFRKFARASLELCNVYIEISTSTGSRRALLSAEMHLKNTVKQGESFSDMEEFRNLEACLNQVKEKLQSDSQAK